MTKLVKSKWLMSGLLINLDIQSSTVIIIKWSLQDNVIEFMKWCKCSVFVYIKYVYGFISSENAVEYDYFSFQYASVN